MPQAELAQAAQRHAALRWVGVPLFGLGLLGVLSGLLTGLGLGPAGGSGWGGVMVYIAATGLSLATFGTHNDTALAYAHQLGPERLSDGLRRELSEELERDRAGLMGLSASPKAALAVTLIALGLHLMGVRWLLNAL